MVMVHGHPDLIRAFSNMKGVCPVDPNRVRVPETPGVCEEVDECPFMLLSIDAIRRLAGKGDELAKRLVPTVNRVCLEQAGQLTLF